jgi:hypothetical protein
MTDDTELRATSDRMLAILDQLSALERRKRELAPGTEAFAALAWDVVEGARTAVRWAELQLRQANQALAGGEAERPLVDVKPRRLDEVLAEWRQAEIRLSQAAPGSREADDAATDAERLRLEYRELQERKLGGDGGNPAV